MAPPDSSFHFQTRARNASRPSASLLVPSAASWRSRITWTAMLAWSVPGTHSVSKPSIRL